MDTYEGLCYSLNPTEMEAVLWLLDYKPIGVISGLMQCYGMFWNESKKEHEPHI
jgi:hypothetical protein